MKRLSHKQIQSIGKYNKGSRIKKSDLKNWALYILKKHTTITLKPGDTIKNRNCLVTVDEVGIDNEIKKATLLSTFL